MRENLIFNGIPEATLLNKELITTQLHLNVTNVIIDRAHSLAGNRGRKPRPIVAKFISMGIGNGYVLNPRRIPLRRIHEYGTWVQCYRRQHSTERREQHNRTTRNVNKQKGQRARIVGNKLYVNNNPVEKFANGSVSDMQGCHGNDITSTKLECEWFGA